MLRSRRLRAKRASLRAAAFRLSVLPLGAAFGPSVLQTRCLRAERAQKPRASGLRAERASLKTAAFGLSVLQSRRLGAERAQKPSAPG